MKRLLLLVGFCLALAFNAMAQKVAIQTNALGWAAYGTVNVGIEPALTPKLTFAVDGYYNPFDYSEGRSTQMWGVQPELRYWFKSKFAGSFVGIHGAYSDYDLGMKKYRYDGDVYAVGASYGYALVLSERWRFNFSVGAGYYNKEYMKSGLPQTDTDITFYGNQQKDGFGLTKAAISVVFTIR